MDRWQRETLGLQVGDFIIWRDEAIKLEGQPVEPGMKGEVISLHDGFHLDVAEVDASMYAGRPTGCIEVHSPRIVEDLADRGPLPV